MSDLNYTCPKCANTDCDVAEMRAAGGFLSKLFDVQSKRFTTVTCTKCSFTELYKTQSSALGNIFDLFVGT